MSVTVDWNDPCARAQALRAAYFGLLSGQAEVRVRFADREVEYQRSDAAAAARLRRELTLAESECAKRCGQRRRRFAIGVR